MATHGKKYRAAAEKITKEAYTVAEACALAKETSTTKFDSSVEMHVRTSADPKYADQLLRGTLSLPHGTGKTVRIAVFCESGEEADAKASGADIVGGQDLIDTVMNGEIDFDIAIATPSMMKLLAKAARVLGPKGLMPSPKSGTVTPDVKKAVTELKAGRIEYRTDKQGIVHSIVGKVSFSADKLTENIEALLHSIADSKPSGVKGQMMQAITITTTMGPAINIDMSTLSSRA